MVDAVITIRPAKAEDAIEIADVHDSAWRDAYRGIIPGRELERMISRRGPEWWRKAILRKSRLFVVDFEDSIAGYVTYGRNRVPALPYQGEIYELYIAPEFQGLGFGRRLFEASRRDLRDHGCIELIVWALAENERAIAFYEKLGGQVVKRGLERFGKEARERIAFGFS